MKILFSIGGFPVHFFGVTIALGVVAGFLIIQREAKRKGLNVEKVWELMTYTLIAGILGARVFYVLFYNLGYYLKNPVKIIMINQGGLSIHGAIIGGLLAAVWYIRKHDLRFWVLADTFAPGIILGQAIGRIGCDVFGKPMELPRFWGISYGGQIVHPAQVYEVILNYLVFFILWRKRKNIKYDGQLFLWYIILFAVNRGIVELFRDNPTIWGGISISHVLSLGLIAGAAAAMYFLKSKRTPPAAAPSSNRSSRFISFLINFIVVISLAAISVAIYYWAWK